MSLLVVWRVDETSMKIKGGWMYLYRAVDAQGNTLDLTCCELRQVKYLNNLIEQDHRFIKRLTKPGMGFFSFFSSKLLQHNRAKRLSHWSTFLFRLPVPTSRKPLFV